MFESVDLLAARHHRALVAHIAGVLPTSRQQDAEDLAQDVWMLALERGEPIDIGGARGLPAALIALVHDVLAATPALPEQLPLRDHHAPVPSVDRVVEAAIEAAPATAASSLHFRVLRRATDAVADVELVLAQHGVTDSPVPAAA